MHLLRPGRFGSSERAVGNWGGAFLGRSCGAMRPYYHARVEGAGWRGVNSLRYASQKTTEATSAAWAN